MCYYTGDIIQSIIFISFKKIIPIFFQLFIDFLQEYDIYI